MRYLICFCVLFLMASRSSAEIYSWVDDSGVRNFSDNISTVPKKYLKSVVRSGQVDGPPAPEKSAVMEKKDAPAAKGTVADNSNSQLYDGKSYSDWRKEFDLQEAELKRIEARLGQIQVLLKNPSNTTRASYYELMNEYNALRGEYKDKYQVYSELMESARKAGLKVDIK
jgi:Domain of unknown function (DUF4124)